MENVGVGSDFDDLSMEKYPVRFMDLLGVHQDITRYALMQSPATPNSSLSEAVTKEDKKRDNTKEEEEHQHKRTKWFKSEKSSDKTKMRVPKVSFITKTEVLHLQDGYNWRKYGQKPVKNNPFPRHYYRCTTCWCDVKKRVERSFSDPRNVITTYEGQHTHPRPLIISKRGNFGSTVSASGPYFSLPTLPPQLHQLNRYNDQQKQQDDLSFLETTYLNIQEDGYVDDHDLVDHEAGLVKDNGLLQDVVSSHMIIMK